MGGEWLLTFVYSLLIAIAIVLVLTLIIAAVAWSNQGSGKNCCPEPLCPAYILNPHPDARTFLLARVDGSTSGVANLCATGSFTVQRMNNESLLYTVTTPPDTFITDIYTLEVGSECDFPLTADGCAVDLTAYHHQSYACGTTTNVQTFTSTIADLCNKSCVNMSILVVMATDDTCDTLQMLTLATGKPIALSGNCVTNPCPANSCCDPIVPNHTKIHLTRCRTCPTLPASPAENPAT